MNYFFTYLVESYYLLLVIKIISKKQIVTLEFLIILSNFDVCHLHKDNNYIANHETQKLRPVYGWKSLGILPWN